MSYAGHVTNCTRLSSVVKGSRRWRMKDHHPILLDPPSSILHSRASILHLLIARPADQRADTHNTKKELVNCNLVRRSDLAKRA
jgi:hypothetical protein